MNKLKKSKIITYVLAFLIPFIVTMIGLFMGEFSPFGGRNVLSAGGFSDFIPYFYELYDRVHEGKSLVFSNATGNGYDFTSLVTYYLSDPTSFIILLFPRDSVISVINMLFAIKVGFAGFAMSYYLSYKFPEKIKVPDGFYKNDDKTDIVIGGKNEPNNSLLKALFSINWIIVAFSVAFALSTPIVTTGLNITFLGAISVFPLVIYGIDRLIDDGKIVYFVLFLCLSIICNMYISFISLVFLFIYLLTRDYKSINHFLTSLVYSFISVVISIFITGIIVVNNIFSVFYQNEISINFPLAKISNPIDIFKQFLTKSTLSVFSLYNTKVDIAFGIAFLFFIVLSCFNKNVSLISRIKDIFLLIFVLFGTFFTTFNYLLNGFNSRYFSKNIFLYLLVFYSIIIAYKTISSISIIKTRYIIISACILFIAIISDMLFSSMYDSREAYIVSIEFLFVYFIITLIFSNKSLNLNLFIILIAAFVVIEIAPNYCRNLSMEGRSYYSRSLQNTSEYQLYETKRYIHKQYQDARVIYINPLEHNSTPITNSFNGYDFILVDEGFDGVDENLVYLDTFKTNSKKAGIDIYINEDCLYNSILDSRISGYLYNEDYPFLSANILSEDYLGGDEIFAPSEMSVSAYAYTDGSAAQFDITSANPGDVYVKMYSISHVGNVNEKKALSVTQYSPYYYTKSVNYVYQIGLFNLDSFKSLINLVKTDGTSIKINKEIKITSDSDAYVMTGFPSINSLCFYVNGKAVKPSAFFDDNSIIPIKEGNNTIEIKYSPKYPICGLFLMIIGFIGFVLFTKRNLRIRLINSASDIIHNNTVYVVSIVIFISVFTLCLMICGCIPFGKASTVAGDGMVIEYADYVARVRTIKEGKFFPYFTFNIGGFKDVFRTYGLRYLTHPWLIIKYSFLPECLYLFDFNFDYFLYSLFSVVTIIYYLTHRSSNRFKKEDYRLIPISIAYSLSGYALAYYSYKAGFLLIPFIPLIILGLEHLVYKKKYSLYICMLSIVMFFDPYHAFLLCEFLILYFFIMRFNGFKDFMTKGLRFALASIIAAGINGASLLPFLMFSKESPYLSNGQTPSFFVFYDSFLKIISDVRVGFLNFVVTTDNSSASIYVGLLITIATLPLYILTSGISLKVKIKHIVLFLILFLAFDNELFNYVFHGFHFQTLVPNRFAIFFVFLVVCMFSDVLYYFKNQLKFVVSLITIFVAMIILYYSYLDEVDYSTVISTIIIVLYIVSIVVLFIKKKNILNYIIYLLIIEVIINSLITFRINNGYYGVSNLAESFDTISDNVPDMKEFYSITEYLGEQANAKNIGDMSDINTLTYFSNIYTMDMFDRLVYYNIGVALNNTSYMSGNPFADMMLHVKYHIEDIYDNEAYSIYDRIYSYNNFVVYKNDYCLPLGFVVQSDVKLKKEYENSIKYQNYITDKLCGEELYNEIDFDTNDSSKDTYYEIIGKYDNDNRISDVDSYSEVCIHLSEHYSGKVYTSVGGRLYFIGVVDSDNHEVYFDVPSTAFEENDYSPSIAILNEEVLDDLYDLLSQNTLYNLDENSHRIIGEIDSKIDGTMYLSFAYSDGWDIYIDGDKVEKERFMGGIGVPISKGKHSVEMKYHCPGSKLGILISILTILSIVFYQFIYRKKKSVVEDETVEE